MTNHFNELTEAEQERLSLLLEECGEVIQIIGKIQRHGYESFNPLADAPLGAEYPPTNRMMLEEELGHVICAARKLWHNRDISESEVDRHADEKVRRVNRWLHHQGVQSAK